MNALIAIGWFLWILIAMYIVNVFHGFAGIVRMFPEGWRWHMPAQLMSLAHFAVVVLLHPF
jgi:hypothetical protein